MGSDNLGGLPDALLGFLSILDPNPQEATLPQPSKTCLSFNNKMPWGFVRLAGVCGMGAGEEFVAKLLQTENSWVKQYILFWQEGAQKCKFWGRSLHRSPPGKWTGGFLLEEPPCEGRASTLWCQNRRLQGKALLFPSVVAEPRGWADWAPLRGSGSLYFVRHGCRSRPCPWPALPRGALLTGLTGPHLNPHRLWLL